MGLNKNLGGNLEQLVADRKEQNERLRQKRI